MSKFIAISGPSATGKTSLVNYLRGVPEFKKAVIGADLYDAVWSDLVAQGFFSEYSEINTDSEYLCVYLMRLIKYYKDYIEFYNGRSEIVILDCCWIDLAVYAITNLWYTRVIKEVQENILSKITELNKYISRIYVTKFDESKQKIDPCHAQYRVANVKVNRPLEIQYYRLAEGLKNAEALPTSDIKEAAKFIVEDLKNLGYI